MNKRIKQELSPMHSHESDGIKKRYKIPRKDDRARELQLLKMHMILSKYLIRNK